MFIHLKTLNIGVSDRLGDGCHLSDRHLPRRSLLRSAEMQPQGCAKRQQMTFTVNKEGLTQKVLICQKKAAGGAVCSEEGVPAKWWNPFSDRLLRMLGGVPPSAYKRREGLRERDSPLRPGGSNASDSPPVPSLGVLLDKRAPQTSGAAVPSPSSGDPEGRQDATPRPGPEAPPGDMRGPRDGAPGSHCLSRSAGSGARVRNPRERWVTDARGECALWFFLLVHMDSESRSVCGCPFSSPGSGGFRPVRCSLFSGAASSEALRSRKERAVQTRNRSTLSAS
ncbi:hypothetical protein Cadr_000030619 [Camelus dromedarius]|uniref:Uncharacterized protein n=1 Tax=Camelus dromedarius TaxID=9838 RepID=A0A5N4C4C3_CAMDR|nr:hypothetical protein Cadr_000030619 [Camelus dromedarius]